MSEEVISNLKQKMWAQHCKKEQLINRAKKASLMNKAALVEQAVELQHNIEAGLLALIGAGEHGESNG